MATLRELQNPIPSLAFKEDCEAPIALIEVTSDGTNRRLRVTEELLETYIEKDYGRASHKFNLPSPSAPPEYESVKLLWSRRLGGYDGLMIPIPTTKDMYMTLAPWVRIPKEFPQSLVNNTALCLMTTPELPRTLYPRTTASQLRNEYLSFIFQSIPGAVNSLCVAASFTYHFPTRQMYIFMHGLACANYDRFARSIENGVAKQNVFLIPSVIIHFNLEQRLGSLNKWHEEIYWNERKVGIRADHHDNVEPESIDYSKLSKDLNAVNSNLSYIIWLCKTTEHQLSFMDSIAKKYRLLAIKNNQATDSAEEMENLLLETHESLRSWNVGLLDRAEYLSKRGQAMVQTVYSGIAQRDSAISLRLAATSTDLATTSQEVAIATSRDSAVMRVIAAITIFFLPATFTATFFSTTFFGFNSDLNGKVYSHWLWLYFLVTIVLTIVVVLGTWRLWKGKEIEVSQRLERRKVE